jgi:hypothetical protein
MTLHYVSPSLKYTIPIPSKTTVQFAFLFEPLKMDGKMKSDLICQLCMV